MIPKALLHVRLRGCAKANGIAGIVLNSHAQIQKPGDTLLPEKAVRLFGLKTDAVSIVWYQYLPKFAR